MPDSPDLDRLHRTLDELEAASNTLVAVGEAHDIPMLRHEARRIRDTIAVVRLQLPARDPESSD